MTKYQVNEYTEWQIQKFLNEENYVEAFGFTPEHIDVELPNHRNIGDTIRHFMEFVHKQGYVLYQP